MPSVANPRAAWRTTHAPPLLDLTPLTSEDLRVLLARIRGGELEADVCEGLLVAAARGRSALDVAIAEGLAALCKGDRLAKLACHLEDYGREVLDLGRRATENLVRLGKALPTRPLLRAALVRGEMKLRAAEIIVAVAVGEAEAGWVEQAKRCTVRELEELVREARRGGAADEDDDERWVRLRTHLPAQERSIVEAGLAIAGEMHPGSSRAVQFEVMAQEYLGSYPGDPDADSTWRLGGVFRELGPRPEARQAALEAETERWAALRPAVEIPAPEVTFDDAASAEEIDATLRGLATLRERWDELVGHTAFMVREARLHGILGFTSFRHYAEERLGVAGKTLEQRASVEKRIWASPPLQEARRQKLPFEKLRLLAALPDGEIGPWLPVAHALTCIDLRRRLDGEQERKMRAQRKLGVPMPRRVAVLLAAAIQSVRDRYGRTVPTSTALAIIAGHFVETWAGALPTRKTRSRKIRERDGHRCQVPGCSHRGTHSHHVQFRSQGGSDDPENNLTLCAFHHLRCIHGGYLEVFGLAPHALTWILGGKVWDGPRSGVREEEVVN